MITLNATQQTILSSTRQRPTWLFIVTTGDGLTTYYWSTKVYTFAAQPYTFGIIPGSFAGVSMQRARSEMGIQGPTELTFSVPNKGNALNPANFVDGTVILRLVVADYAGNEEIIRGWKFRVRTCANIYQVMSFTCADFLQDILAGHYPTLPLVKDIFLSKNTDQDTTVCVPLPFGTAYIPLRPIYTASEFFYMLGPGADGTFTITELRSPRSYGAKSTWLSADYTFTQSVKTDALARDWKVLSPKIAKSWIGLSVPDATGFWMSGERFSDVPTKYSWSVTSAMTGPAAILQFILTNATYGMGLASADWDAAAQTAAAATFTGWGLTWNGALWRHEEREKILSRLLRMCHSVLDVGEDVSIRVLSKTSQETITSAAILREKGKGRGEFQMTAASRRQQPDGAYVSWQEAGESQDDFYRTLIPVVDGVTPTRPANDTFECPWVQDSQKVQRLAILDAQRKYLPAGEVSFQTKPGVTGIYCQALQPDDIITIDGSNYGGTYDVLIDSMKINRNGTCDFRCNLLS